MENPDYSEDMFDFHRVPHLREAFEQVRTRHASFQPIEFIRQCFKAKGFDTKHRQVCISSLSAFVPGSDAAVDLALEALSSRAQGVIINATAVLARGQDPRSLDALKALIDRSPSPRIQQKAKNAILAIEEKDPQLWSDPQKTGHRRSIVSGWNV